MTIEKGKQGQWIITAIINGYLVSKQFFGYSKKDAIALFKKDCFQKGGLQ
jgi:hypothetical protein